MKKLIIVLLALISFNYSFSFERTKVLYAINGGIQAEKKYVEIFIAGYESVGGTWTGESDTVDASNSEFFTIALPLALSNGCNLVTTNFPLEFYANIPGKETLADNYYVLGIQSVVASGSNQYHFLCHPPGVSNVVTVSGGDTAGMTGYWSEFFNDHPFNDYNIVSMSQGTNDTAIVQLDISVNRGFWLIQNTPVIFRNVIGFSSGPSGLNLVVKFIENGQWNSFKIIHDLGTGSFTSGDAKLFFESYATPYTAGMLAFIRDSLECSWWEARYRMRMTASGEGSYTQYNGYGKPNVLAAINYSGEIPADPYDVLGPVGNITAWRNKSKITVQFDSVGNALNYHLFDRSVLIGSYTSHGEVVVNIERNGRNYPHEFWYKALRADQESSESKKAKIPYYRYPRINIK